MTYIESSSYTSFAKVTTNLNHQLAGFRRCPPNQHHIIECFVFFMFFFVNPRSEEIFHCVSLHRCFPQTGGGGKLLGSQETRGVLKTFLENVLRDSSDPEIWPNENKKGSVWKLRKKKPNILTPKAPHTKHKKPSNKETCEIAVLVAFI